MFGWFKKQTRILFATCPFCGGEIRAMVTGRNGLVKEVLQDRDSSGRNCCRGWVSNILRKLHEK
jgi:hypothetical protein